VLLRAVVLFGSPAIPAPILQRVVIAGDGEATIVSAEDAPVPSTPVHAVVTGEAQPLTPFLEAMMLRGAAIVSAAYLADMLSQESRVGPVRYCDACGRTRGSVTR